MWRVAAVSDQALKGRSGQSALADRCAGFMADTKSEVPQALPNSSSTASAAGLGQPSTRYRRGEPSAAQCGTRPPSADHNLPRHEARSVGREEERRADHLVGVRGATLEARVRHHLLIGRGCCAPCRCRPCPARARSRGCSLRARSAAIERVNDISAALAAAYIDWLAAKRKAPGEITFTTDAHGLFSRCGSAARPGTRARAGSPRRPCPTPRA